MRVSTSSGVRELARGRTPSEAVIFLATKRSDVNLAKPFELCHALPVLAHALYIYTLTFNVVPAA